MSALDKLMGKYGQGLHQDAAPLEAAAGPPALPEPVQELAELLQRIPVRIVCTASRTAIEQRPGWIRREEWRRISDLVFFDAACWRFLHDHPDRVISAANFIRQEV